MKILIVEDLEVHKSNLFVKELAMGLSKLNLEVIVDTDMFWFNDTTHFDVIHLQWPESIFKWRNPSDIELYYLQQRIDFWKKKSKIIYTRHNSLPHCKGVDNLLKLYQIIEKNSNAIIHLGAYSKEEIKDNNAIHTVIEHHVYDNTYTNTKALTKEVARKKLNLKEKDVVFLAFGSFRTKQESRLITEAFSKINIPNKVLLAPRLDVDIPYTYSKSLRYIDKFIINKIKKIATKDNRIISNGGNFIDDNELPYYFAASDAVILQRLNTLNSGNLSMAFWFGKTVIGPNSGNMNSLLKQTNNLIFNPNNLKSTIETLESISALDLNQIGERNYDYALNKLTTEKIAGKIYEFYCNVLSSDLNFNKAKKNNE
ncbi:hypothetical protein FNB79_06725 [Formosa sediminum]|uniref:Glycosyltransferase family 4 protein n=1 Tax=Formosa sediminum TaxID=2594004 RepID=A0A516GQ75_9FLAO|nr:hypothetical protein [Formosa sediminum]QDO93681.1 hypothetical protein FNB79_06725 [Formosa sediminum]